MNSYKQGQLFLYLFIGTRNFHYYENYEPQKTIFFSIIRTESMPKYVCRVYHQLSQYIAKLTA
jgi:hypothetical protein